MAKKSFVDAINPAEMFISKQPEQTARQAEIDRLKDAARKKKAGEEVAPLTEPKQETVSAPATHDYTGTKSRHVQMLINPCLYDDVKAIADAKGVSVNEYMNQVLIAAVKAEWEE